MKKRAGEKARKQLEMGVSTTNRTVATQNITSDNVNVYILNKLGLAFVADGNHHLPLDFNNDGHRLHRQRADRLEDYSWEKRPSNHA